MRESEAERQARLQREAAEDARKAEALAAQQATLQRELAWIQTAGGTPIPGLRNKWGGVVTATRVDPEMSVGGWRPRERRSKLGRDRPHGRPGPTHRTPKDNPAEARQRQ